VAIGAALTLARFSEAFLVLRAAGLGLAPTYVPLVVVAMSAAYAASSYPAGVLADTAGRRAPLLAGLAALVLADLVLAAATSVTAALVGAALWGLHMGLTQGLLSAMVADAAPPRCGAARSGCSTSLPGGAAGRERGGRGTVGHARAGGDVPRRGGLRGAGGRGRAGARGSLAADGRAACGPDQRHGGRREQERDGSSRSPRMRALASRVRKVWTSWTCPTFAIPPRARPAYQK
jgi:hypothetical protein